MEPESNELFTLGIKRNGHSQWLLAQRQEPAVEITLPPTDYPPLIGPSLYVHTSENSAALPIVSIVVPFFGLTKYIIRIL